MISVKKILPELCRLCHNNYQCNEKNILINDENIFYLKDDVCDKQNWYCFHQENSHEIQHQLFYYPKLTV